MHKVKEIFQKSRLALFFAITVFFIMLITMLLVFAGIAFLNYHGIIHSGRPDRLPLVMFAIISLIVGVIFSMLFSRLPLAPLYEIMNAADQIAKGNYDVQIGVHGPREFQQLGTKFNHMAKELGSVEILRTDFVNNFSHEFKTPIVSIRGFAKMLKMENLSPEERDEYLDIIIEESERLTELATNVLNLSKIEQQTILTDRKIFNASEQIRLAIALLDSKWMNKDIHIAFDCEEVFLEGNEEMLRQVWINLLDNAIKFSPDHEQVTIDLNRGEDFITFSFKNRCEQMTPEIVGHAFDKFYQGDTSHATKGNGLGLTISKKIAELHGGSITIDCPGDNEIIFRVILPLKECA